MENKADNITNKRALKLKITAMQASVAAGYIPAPTRTFVVGEKVEYRHHTEAKVIASYGGAFYEIEVSVPNGNQNSDDAKKIIIAPWLDLFHLNQSTDTCFENKSILALSFSQGSIGFLLSALYKAGLETNEVYHRPLVWTLSDNRRLIDAIFNKVDIGKIVLTKNTVEADKKSYEVIDGKQRLAALVDFYEDRLHYRDTLYSELSSADKQAFLATTVQTCVVNNWSLKGRMTAFIALNAREKEMSFHHFKRVAAMRDALDDSLITAIS